MSADRDITPRVIAYIRAGLPTIELEQRVSPLVAQEVLRQLARWARRTAIPGVWSTTESVDQIVTGTGIRRRSVCKALDCLARLDLVGTVKRGGGHGFNARGSTRTLRLDPVDNRSTSAGNRHEFNPQLVQVDPSTGAGNGSTGAGQPAHSASSSALSSARAPTSCSSCTDGYVTTEGPRGIRIALKCPECQAVTR